MSRTYFALRHCKGMTLQVGMEEGPRSKAACVSGLQYCNYSEKKINSLLYCQTSYIVVPYCLQNLYSLMT